jgi:hypothetical protein
MDRYLDVLDVEVTTRARYEAAIRLHVRPLLTNCRSPGFR